MRTLRLFIAMCVAKILTFAGRLIGKNSSSFPGSIALKICPDIIRILSFSVKKEIIITCGTNGKTTVNNLLYNALMCSGYSVVCNTAGSNMLGGVATAFVQLCDIFGKSIIDFACLEVDEAFAVKLFEHLKPTCIVVTNLFRDQLDRYGEIDITSKLLKSALNKADNAVLILNGDDPLTACLGTDNSYYFGIVEQILPQNDETREGRFCGVCGHEIEYNYLHYSQLGDFYCPSCGYKRPHIDFAVHDTNIQNGLKFKINDSQISLNYKGFYNIYNVLAAYSALSALNVDVAYFNTMVSNYKPQIGRMEEFMLNKPVMLNLSKNPAGFNQTIMTVQNDNRKKDVIIAINDKVADGFDISWIWDVDFDKLGDKNLNSLAVTGIRAYDMALRFKYAEVDYIVCDMMDAIKNSLNSDSEVCYVLVNYTALFPTHKILTKFTKDKKVGGAYV